MTKLTKEQAIIMSGFTGILCADSVSVAEFKHHFNVKLSSNPELFTELKTQGKNMEEILKEFYREDFLNLIYKEQ